MPVQRRTGRWPLHGALLIGLAICTLGFVVELRRGVSGHYLAWVYVVEWPLFAACGTYMWWRLLHEDDRDPASTGAPTVASSPATAAVDDPELAAWLAHVERMDAAREQD